jgi:hypothetical protein
MMSRETILAIMLDDSQLVEANCQVSSPALVLLGSWRFQWHPMFLVEGASKG